MKNQNEKTTQTNNTTELVFILDRSGSMSGLESDTIGGFNAMIEKQKKQEGECYVSTFLFDSETQLLHDRVSLSQISKMTDNDYTVGGCTALLDAVGEAVKHIEKIHKYARKEDIPANTMFVITTDGMENASRHYSSDEIKKLISRQKEKRGWEFLFIGANIDAIETAAKYGISEDRAVNYNADSKGTKVVYEAVSKAVCGMRRNKSLDSRWSDEIAEDFKSRK
ncbi:MAG: VWA domain-containing protein [Ruminococcaceae bacterium]|nr:VWA domain-containing protein [Oscillospiraceae bacterium]